MYMYVYMSLDIIHMTASFRHYASMLLFCKCVYVCQQEKNFISLSHIFRFLLQNGQLQHNPTLGCFTVIGSAGKPHVVKLFPTQSCSCPATSQCYHILSVKMSVGIEVHEQTKKVNLTQLRRNTRSRKEKRSGRKAPRAGA